MEPGTYSPRSLTEWNTPRPQGAALMTHPLEMTASAFGKRRILFEDALSQNRRRPEVFRGSGRPLAREQVLVFIEAVFVERLGADGKYFRSFLARSAPRFSQKEAPPAALVTERFAKLNTPGGSFKADLMGFVPASSGSQLLSNFALQPPPGAVGVLAQVVA